MKAIVKIRDRQSSKLVAEKEFNSKKEAMECIKATPISSDVVITGNYKHNGKNFFNSYILKD